MNKKQIPLIGFSAIIIIGLLFLNHYDLVMIVLKTKKILVKQMKLVVRQMKLVVKKQVFITL